MKRRTAMIAADLMAALLLMLVILPHKPEIAKTESITPPGNLIVEITWPQELDCDIDLWVKDPDNIPVGYSNKGGPVFDLVRDDLGHHKDMTDLNYEVAFSRGLPEGEYVVNVHFYRNSTKQRLIVVPVAVKVSMRKENGTVHLLLTKRVELERQGQEVTVARFVINEDGFVKDSVNAIPRALRSW